MISSIDKNENEAVAAYYW